MSMNKMISNYVDYKVRTVIRIKEDSFGYRVVLIFSDGSEKVQQKSGFKSRKAAEKAREYTIAELINGTYIVHSNISVKEYVRFWLEDKYGTADTPYNTYTTYKNTIENHIIPFIGGKKMNVLNAGDIQKLYKTAAETSEAIAKNVKAVINVAMADAVTMKVVSRNVSIGVNLPKTVSKPKYHQRTIDSQKTLNQEQLLLLIEKSKDTPIYLQVLFNALMGLRRSEIIGLKYQDIDWINRRISVGRQLGRVNKMQLDDVKRKTLTKQEKDLKTYSSKRNLPIPDLVYEAILEERKRYEKNRNRRKREFNDQGYICCSTYGNSRSKDFHYKYFKQLLRENELPDVRWHDLRASYTTLLLKNNFSSKAISKLMGHAGEIITVDVYGDNHEIITDCTSELLEFIEDVIPDNNEENLLDIVIDVSRYLPDADVS